MKRSVVFGLAAGLFTALSGADIALSSDRAFSDDNTIQRSGNWGRAATGSEQSPAKKSGAKKKKSRDAAAPVPRPKPGSKAAKREAAKDKKKARVITASKPEDETEETATPKPRKKAKAKKPAQAGLAPSTGGSTSAPYRGGLDSNEIKEVLGGKTVASRIDGNDARITLADDGTLNWTSPGGSGQGRWWTEKGRVCDRYDPAGDFPGRGTGCRSFEQKSDGYYAGGRKLQFLN